MGTSRFSLLALSAALLLSGCFAPNGTHVTYGTRPQVIDDDVRFRTTYYFRVFDYCWAADLAAARTVGADPRPISYRAIIPETDTLYRYRMTGKASSLFSNVRFSSGTLPVTAIDPFGSDVSYSEKAAGFVVRSPTEVKEADAAARTRDQAESDRKAAWMRYQQLTDALFAYDKLKNNSLTDTRAEPTPSANAPAKPTVPADDSARKDIEAARKVALDQFVGRAPIAPVDDAKLAALAASLTKIASATADNQSDVRKVIDEIAKLRAEAGQKPTLTDGCPIGDQINKGFQIMGPEGIRTYRQDERLLLAMSTSAQPLIETLQEYSQRILSPKTNRSEMLLPIARESVRTETARRAALEAAAAGVETSPFVAARTAFEAKP